MADRQNEIVSLVRAIKDNMGSGGGGGGDAKESTSQAILAEIGSAGSGQSPTLFGAVEDATLSATTVQSMADSWAAMVTNRATLQGYTFVGDTPINNISDILYKKDLLKSVNDSSVTSITCPNALGYCMNLKSLSLPQVTSISGSGAFQSCTSLQSVSLPLLTTITSSNTFSTCTSLQSISFPELTTMGGTYLFNGCTSLQSVSFPKLTSISGGNMFQGCTSLQSVSFPLLVSISGASTFTGCSNLKSISFPLITTIAAQSTFNSCVNLIDITFGASVTASISVNTWSPTNALSSSSTSLVDEGETFTSNLEKLLYNIRNHIAANLPDRTGLSSLTITFSSAVKAAIQADTATTQAFTNKNWTIA